MTIGGAEVANDDCREAMCFRSIDTEEATKAEQETAYQAELDTNAAEAVRADRDERLAKTDWRASSDLTLSSEWTTYRQALRDVPAQSGFPHDISWPTEPE